MLTEPGPFALSSRASAVVWGRGLFFLATVLLVLVCLFYPWRLYYKKYGTSRTCPGKGWTDYRPLAACCHCGHRQCLEAGAPVQEVLCEACGLRCRT